MSDMHKNLMPLEENGQPFSMDEGYDLFEINGTPYLFAQFRVNRETIPADKFPYVYDVADNSDYRPVYAKAHLLVNHMGTMIGIEPLPVDEEGYYYPKLDEDYNKRREEFETSLEDLSDDERYLRMEEWESENWPENDEAGIREFEAPCETAEEFLEVYDELKAELQEERGDYEEE